MGVDFTARWQQPLTDKQMISATVNYSLQRVVNRTNSSSPYYNNQIAYMPKYTGGMSLSWENPWVNLSIHGEGISSRWTNNEHLEGTLVNGYWEMGTTAWRSFRLTKRKETHEKAQELNLRFDLKNMFNKQYEIVGAYPMPGRNWQFTIGYQF
jgi:outer membrane cobalamin receptor